MTTTERSRVNLRIPGPVPLPDDVLELAGSQMINHRAAPNTPRCSTA